MQLRSKSCGDRSPHGPHERDELLADGVERVRCLGIESLSPVVDKPVHDELLAAFTEAGLTPPTEMKDWVDRNRTDLRALSERQTTAMMLAGVSCADDVLIAWAQTMQEVKGVCDGAHSALHIARQHLQRFAKGMRSHADMTVLSDHERIRIEEWLNA